MIMGDNGEGSRWGWLHFMTLTLFCMWQMRSTSVVIMGDMVRGGIEAAERAQLIAAALHTTCSAYAVQCCNSKLIYIVKRAAGRSCSLFVQHAPA
jgi:hypothetical protein